MARSLTEQERVELIARQLGVEPEEAARRIQETRDRWTAHAHLEDVTGFRQLRYMDRAGPWIRSSEIVCVRFRGQFIVVTLRGGSTVEWDYFDHTQNQDDVAEDVVRCLLEPRGGEDPYRG